MTAILMLFFMFASFSSFGTCKFENTPVILPIIEDNSKYLLYQERNHTYFWESSNGMDPLLQTFRTSVANTIQSTDPYDLLRRQRQVFNEHFGGSYDAAYDAVINSELGQIRALSCMEQLLFVEHLKHLKPIDVFSEFRAIILLSPQNRLKIYFGSTANYASAPQFLEVIERVKIDKENGFRVLYDLHNHPFLFDNPHDVSGTTIPSVNDAINFVKEVELFSLEKASIINGFNTIMLRNDEFYPIKELFLSGVKSLNSCSSPYKGSFVLDREKI